MKTLLTAKNPFPPAKFDMKKCIICKSNMGNWTKSPCYVNNVGYRLVCILKVDEGETSGSAQVAGRKKYRMEIINKFWEPHTR